MRRLFPVFFALLGWAVTGHASAQADHVLRPDTATWTDTARGRAIPIALYSAENTIVERPRIAIISHGWNENLQGTYLKYGYLGEFLAEHGYLVVSIQHELPGNEPLAMKGDLRILRRPNWERGAGNIAFVLAELRRRWPELDFGHTVLIGHSNGGDMSALFAERHPEAVANLITLDNLRMPLPRSGTPRVLTLRASDTSPDTGVLPSADEAARAGLRIVDLPTVRHNEMNDRANAAQRELITGTILRWLQDR